MKVAVVQMRPAFKDKVGNLRKMVKATKQAVDAGAKLIVFPELVSTGYSFMSAAEAAPYAEVIGPMTRPLQSDQSMHIMLLMAKQWQVSIVWGLVERDPVTGKLHNSQVYVDPTGYFESYRKVNSFGNDYIWATPGEGSPPIIQATIEGKRRKIGLLICRDVRDKSDDDTSFYEKGDADIVCLGCAWGDGGFPATVWMDFVKKNKCYLAVSNVYGKEIPNNFGEGGVCVIAPDGKVHCEGLVWSQDCIVYADIP